MKYSTDFILIYYVSIFLAFLIISLVVSTLLFVLSRVFIKVIPQFFKKRLEIKKSILTGIIITGIVSIVYFVIPTVAKDSNWRNKQSECAKEAGYSNPGDDNTTRATAKSQKIFRECLNK